MPSKFLISARSAAATETIWRYEGEDVTLSCPGFNFTASATHSLEYSWFKQEYNCNGMDDSTIIATHNDHTGGR